MKHLMLDIMPLGSKLGHAIGQVGIAMFDDASITDSIKRAAWGHMFPAQQSLAYGLEIEPSFLQWLNKEGRTLEQSSAVNNSSTASLFQAYTLMAGQLDRAYKADRIHNLWYTGYIDRLHQLIHAFEHIGVELPYLLRPANRLNWFHADSFDTWVNRTCWEATTDGMKMSASAQEENIAYNVARDKAASIEAQLVKLRKLAGQSFELQLLRNRELETVRKETERKQQRKDRDDKRKAKASRKR